MIAPRGDTVLDKLFSKVLGGSKHERDIKKIFPLVEEINRFAEEYKELSDEQLQAKTSEFRSRLEKGETLDDLLPETFAAVKDTCRRLLGKSWDICGLPITWDMVPFDVQLIGAIVLHQGKIAEMVTGEGKTLVATMPLYLNALTGRGVHLVTVNDYLARRDREWMGQIYEFLGLTVDVIQHDMDPQRRKEAYRADITYGTNNEFGFDYLRDNMAVRLEDRVQRGYHYAIVDEVDSVLIDEARTPLIISGPVAVSTHRFQELKPRVEQLCKRQIPLVNGFVAEGERLLQEGKEYEAGIKLLQAQRGDPKNRKLMKIVQEPGVKKLITRVELDFMRDKRISEIDDQLFYVIDERSNTIDLQEKGRKLLSPQDQKLFTMPDLSEGLQEIDSDPTLAQEEKAKKKERFYREYGEKSEKLHNISQLLKAYNLFKLNEEYVVSEDGKVMIVDEFTGRLMPGRRYSDGLHQAIEAKEGVTIERETQTLATITLQNFFRLYEKLAGMTGTAETEEGEFFEIYKLEVVVIPTNEPIRRDDRDDLIYRTRREKYNAVIEEIALIHQEGLPVLVGTVDVKVSETLSRMLKRRGIQHSVLNAKYHQKEAKIIVQAGQPGAVTIATNMAGRGTDIKLGPGVIRFPQEHVKALASRVKSLVSSRERVVIHEIPPEQLDLFLSVMKKEDVSPQILQTVEEKRTVLFSDNGLAPGEVAIIPRSLGAPNDSRMRPQDLRHVKARDFSEGGLHIVGTERHEARRIDRQLRGRCGRQGDPGATRFYLSLEDDLMRLFGSDRISAIMDKLGVEEGEVIQHPMVTKAIQRAQKRVEAQNFAIRKHLLEYDDVMNQQREVVYDRRLHALEGDDLKTEIMEMIEGTIEAKVQAHTDPGLVPEKWDLEGLQEELRKAFFLNLDIPPEVFSLMTQEKLRDVVSQAVKDAYRRKEEGLGEEMMRQLERFATLRVIDERWKEHLYEMDLIKEGIGLRAYGQKDPLFEYKREGFETFREMLERIDQETVELIFRAQVTPRPEESQAAQVGQRAYRPAAPQMASSPVGQRDQLPPAPEVAPDPVQVRAARSGRQQPVRAEKKVGRNDPCPCGSGKKYKKCCGA
jgi:preprotein translocase subunit SecA